MSRSLSRAIVLGWARWYTAGLPAAARDERLAELESDCFEHLRDCPGVSGALLLLLRCLLGMPADLAWRFEQLSPGRHFVLGAALAVRVLDAAGRLAAAVLAVTPLLLAAFYLLVSGVVVAAALTTEPDLPWFRIVAPWALVAAALVVAGWRTGAREPRKGALLIAAGGLPLGLVLVATVAALPLALAATVQALVRVHAASRRRSPVTA